MKWELLLLLLHLLFVFAQEKNPCLAHRECGQCLRASGECAYCKDPDYTKVNYTRPRCNYASNLKGCKSIMNIKGSSTQTDQVFGSTKQVSPTKISLKLRPDLTHKVTIKVKPAKDFPVDLYYLMDMSKSMDNDLANLMKLGTKIADEIEKVTPNYRLAFGSFVDKTVAPFIQPTKLAKLETYGYKHIQDFTDNKFEFTDKVKEQKISGNLDTPEGGFDALMQVSTCGSKLKWQAVELAHRLVVFVTDASPHIAGDGRLGGILTPNDAQCHLSGTTNPLTYSLTNSLDYPSISKLKQVLKDNDIIPIFAVTKEVQAIYQKLGKEWKDLNAAVGVLANDSSNIVQLIREKYSEIIQRISLSDNSPKSLTVKYKADSSCPSVNEDGNVCNKIKAGTEYSFDVLITLISCPKDRNEWDKTISFTITAPGLGKIDVDAQLICECDCEKVPVTKSSVCSNHGTQKCGICYCDPNRFGENCECGATEQGDDSKCRKSNSTNTDVVCSGAGNCVCGKCECNKRPNPGEFISGKFCECNNYGCDRFNNLLCGGPERGTCECGRCKCTEAFLGDNCGLINCTIAEKNCFNNQGVKCSGHGTCNCNTCDCEKGYGGKFCEECVSCPSKCSNYKDCVQCKVWNEGPLAEGDKCKQCDQFDIQIVNKTAEVCEYKDDNNCFFHFNFYQKADGNETILVQRNKRCVVVVTKAAPILAIVLGIIGGLILLALILLLLWKLLITAYDNYEYQKFLKENQNPNWANTNNPIYKPSQTNYQNPTYAGKS